MKVTVFCSDPTHPVWPGLSRWCHERGQALVSNIGGLGGGDLLILVSCTHIVPAGVRARYRYAMVIHESAVPQGRGWSPLAWQILAGQREFTVSLLECADPVDSGAIWGQCTFTLEGHELSDEINAARDRVRLALMDDAINLVDSAVKPTPQRGEPSWYLRRTPENSRLDPLAPIADQFDLLRICDPRFPAFFELRGHRYEVTLRKVEA